MGDEQGGAAEVANSTIEVLATVINALNNGSGTAWAILISASLAFIAVFVSGWLHRKTQPLVLAYQSQMTILWDKEYQDYRQQFIKMRDGDGNALIALAAEKSQGSEEAMAVRTIMNDYELIATGIKRKIVDEQFHRDFYETTTVLDYQKMLPYILEVRRVYNNRKLYIEFEKMVFRWRPDIKSNINNTKEH